MLGGNFLFTHFRLGVVDVWFFRWLLALFTSLAAGIDFTGKWSGAGLWRDCAADAGRIHVLSAGRYCLSGAGGAGS